jgi:hypothetical protein
MRSSDLRTAVRRAVRSPLERLRRAYRSRRLIDERRRSDADRAEEFRAANRAEIARSGDVHGSPGWLIRTEQTYSPSRDRYRATNSRLSPNRRLVNSGGDKMGLDRNGYAPAYADILRRWIGQGPALVELGAFRGSGLALWCELFTDGHIVGLDVDLEHFRENEPALRARGAFSERTPDVLQFDAYSPDTTSLEQSLDGRRIDVFIDDGPHKEDPSCLVAARILPLLADRFTYVVEDVDEIYGCLREVFAGCRIEQVSRGLVVIDEGDAAGSATGAMS